MPTPEEIARQNIDALLQQCGWVIQNYKQLDLSAGKWIAIREVRLKEGRCDYLLLIDRKPVGIIEAKKAGVTLSTVAFQSGQYAKNLPDFLRGPLTGHLPFLYESTGTETFFRDERDPHPRSRRVFAFHRPETLAKWLEEPDTLRRRLAEMPFKHPYNGEDVRGCRVEAISGLEQSFAEAQPRALIQMATGAGKTLTACAFTYRLIKHAGARNVLFLVDRANLGRQAMAEFQQFVTPDGRKFTELYNVQHLTSNKLDGVCRVTICTIQRLYAMLRGEELNESAEEISGYKVAAAIQSASGVSPLNPFRKSRDGSSTLDVQYNAAIPIETFDFIIADECHRSIYNLWRQVLEYFDAFLIGLTVTPGKQAIGFFNKNLVSEYPHERAVADGVNVGYDVYRIKTQVTEQGGTIEKGLFVDRRDKKTRKLRWEELDDDLPYTAKELDRSVVVKDQIRTVLQAFRDALPQLFPGRNLVPKTLIFCKDDSHAEDVVHICREVFGKGNDFCKKITYQSKHPETGRPAQGEQLIQEFRLSPQLRIAVTVDMIATGTDVKPLECLVFLRDVRSRVYFEQMKGRGTRVLSPTDLQAVSGAEAQAKTHFVIVDAVGVCESDKTDSRPLDRKPTEKLESILLGVALGKRDEDTLTTLASRLARLEQALDADEKSRIAAVTGGKTLSEMANKLLQSVDPDIVEVASRRLLSDRIAEGPEGTYGSPSIGYFDRDAPVANLAGNLPHWRQPGVTYFVTFRLADALPQERLNQWRKELGDWMHQHPEPHDEATRQEFYDRFPARLQRWLDAGYGSCVLSIPEVRSIVENALRHFNGERYDLDELAVASNHVHVLVTPLGEYELSDILHSWKSFTAHEILKVEAASRRLSAAQLTRTPVNYSGTKVAAASRRDLDMNKSRDGSSTVTVWQKESFDHIVRSPESLDKFRAYIRAHNKVDEASRLVVSEELRRDAAATLIAEACSPFDKPEVRDTLVRVKRESEQTIDVTTIDTVIDQGFDAAAKDKAESLIKSFRDYIAEHQSEIDALQILYSRPYKQRLTEPMLKELEKKLREVHAAWTEDRLWDAFAVTAPGKVKGRSQAGRFADLVALVRFALEQQPVLAPFADSVSERFNEWLMDKAKAGTVFSQEQLAWLNLMRDQVATSLSIEPDDLDLSPFNQRGGLGKAHQLFGEKLPALLEELNLRLVA
jgi:type I restriction enzyme R subunit